MKRKISKIIATAKRKGRVAGGLVLCDNCDTPASRSLSQDLHWTACAPCVWGESDSFDATDLIAVPEVSGVKRFVDRGLEVRR